MNTKVGIIMGSDSDLDVMKEAAIILEYFNIDYELTIVSAHRTPDRLYEYGKNAKEKNIKLIIAGAGGAAHLPGMIASITPIPVIGVPIKTSTLNGVDSMYSILQMPPGVPVATMAINGAKNAALYAGKIIGTYDKNILEKVEEYMKTMENEVIEKAIHLEKLGYEKYLNNRN